MDVGPADEVVELTEDRWILLVYSRRWPRYVIDWSIRQRSGDSDYPVQAGQVDAAPSQSDPDRIWADLRQRALDQARAAEESAAPADNTRSLLSRLFGRR